MQTDLHTLDDLVEEYMLQEELTDKDSSSGVHTSLSVRRACELVRTLVEQGNICAALAAVPEECQKALKDQRLVFQLKKQEIVEHLRKGTSEAQQQALDCIRHDYASLAENAYPEAYSQFKHSMLLLIFDEELQTSPVKQDWSLQTRSELAGTLCRTLRQTAGVYPSTLSLLLRHLVRSYQTYHMHRPPAAVTEEIRKLPEQLLSSSRANDPPPLPCEDQGGAASAPWPLAVEDAQALVTALDVPWEAASHLLRHTRGDLTAAFKNELSAHHLNEKLLDELVWEYAAHRGLLSLTAAPGSHAGTLESNHTRSAPCEHVSAAAKPSQHGKQDSAKGRAGRRGGVSDLHASSEQSEHGGRAASAVVASDQPDQHMGPGSEAQPRYAGSSSSRKRDAPGPSLSPDKPVPHGGCSTSGRGSSMQSPPRKVPCWKGRTPHPVLPEAQAHSSSCNPPLPFQQTCQSPHESQGTGLHSQVPLGRADTGNSPALRQLPHAQKYTLLHTLSQRLESGQLEEIFREIKSGLDPDFLTHHPDLLFELHRCQFHALLDAGNTDDALRLVRSELTPLSQQHPQLQPKLKASMACLLPGSGFTASTQHCIAAASGLLQEALRATLGLPQPRLLNLMQMLLESHQGWYHVQRCRDRFESLLRLDQLKGSSEKASSGPTSSHRASAPVGSSGDACMADAAGNISSDHESDQQESDAAMSEPDEVVLSDDVIRITMEFTGLPRHQVIDLLLHNDGDPTAVMAQLFP